MSLLDSILSQVMSSGQAEDHHFDQAVQHATPGQLGQGITGAFNSKETPPIGDMVSQLFGNSNGQQQAGMLNQLLGAIGPAAAAALAGGALSKIMSPGSQQVTPAQAAQLSPEQVQQVVTQAHAQDPSISDQLGAFYANHSGLVKTLGGAALLIAMTKMKDGLANRT
jgi:hypothetical protein